jgi:uncharacterized protein (TIGR03067 family)
MRLVSAFAMAVLCLGIARADDAADLKVMVGKWKVEKATLSGKDVTEHVKDMKFEIMAGGKYRAQVGEEVDESTFTVDAAKKPAELDVKPMGGPQKGKIVKGIYKLDGDTMTICYNYMAGDRPKAFESKENTNDLLIVYKRIK